MLRRHFFLAFAVAHSVWLSGCAPPAPSKITVNQMQLQQDLQARFPQQYPIAGLMRLDLRQPQLQLLPASNQLQTTLDVSLSGPTLRKDLQGHMHVRFGLVYQPQDDSVQAQRVEVLALQLEGASPALSNMLQTYGLRVAQQALQGFSLHTVSAKDLKQVQRMGLQLGAVTVTAQGFDVAVQAPQAQAAHL